MGFDNDSTERHMFQATYSGNLQLAVRNIVMAFNDGDLLRAFSGCETLRDLLPRLWKEIDEQIYTQITDEIVMVTRRHMEPASVHIRRTGLRNAIDSIKKKYVRDFFEKIIILMDKHNYLDLGWTPISNRDFEQLENVE